MTELEKAIERYKANGGQYFNMIKERSPKFRTYEPLYPYNCFVAKNAGYFDNPPSNTYTVLQFHNEFKNIIQIDRTGQYKTLAEARNVAKNVDHIVTEQEVNERKEEGKRALIKLIKDFNSLMDMKER